MGEEAQLPRARHPEPQPLDRIGLFQAARSRVEALALAGGLNAEAGRTVRLTRQSGDAVQSILIDLDRLAVDGDIRLNLALLPDDVINVPRAGMFYVEGMVRSPGAYPMLSKTTITQAIATAGGIDVAVARTEGTTLYRKSPDGPDREAIELDLAAIRAGRAEDPLVQADDLIVVPVAPSKLVVDRLTGLLRIGTQF